MDIIYFDNHLVIANKPAGIPTQSLEEESVESQARTWVKKQFNKEGNAFLYTAHRLDKPVSGIVLLAKTSKALTRLQAAFREKQMKKMYVALVEGSLQEESGVLENYLAQEEFRTTVVSSSHPKGKLCRLSYRVIKRFSDACLIEVDLETGRYHQIRAQLAHLGHPIVGDIKYGAKSIATKRKHIALHHQKIELAHPVTKESLIFTAEPPKQWKQWADELSVLVQGSAQH